MKQGSVSISPTIMSASRKLIEQLHPISVVDIYDGASKQFNPNGLFSSIIFGRIGSPERTSNYAYIDLKVPVFHPLIFGHFKRLKALYVGIMSGTAFAVWDAKLKDFVRSDEQKGSTGYAFFVKHYSKINYTDTGSMQRELRVDVIKKFGKDAMRDTCIVIAAGMRDVMVDEDGRTSYDEVNDLYKKLIAISNTIVASSGIQGADDDDLAVHDLARWNLQRTMNEIYDYLFNIVFGKDKLIQSKWAGRNVFNGTRNVLSNMTPHTADLDGAETPEIDSTQVGVYQTSRAMFPVTSHMIIKGWPSTIVDVGSGTATVFKPKSLEPVSIDLKRATADRWTTSNGVSKTINSLENVKLRDQPVMIDGHYLGLLYQDEVGFKFVSATDVLNENITKEQLALCRPITLIELMYCLLYAKSKQVYSIVTRYPVAGMGSTYPSKVHLRSTVRTKVLREYLEDWTLSDDDEHIATAFPILDDNVAYFDSMAVAQSAVTGLSADYDGD